MFPGSYLMLVLCPPFVYPTIVNQSIVNFNFVFKQKQKKTIPRNYLQINCDADRRKAADIRELKDSYEIRLTQIQKSAKTEISRLVS